MPAVEVAAAASSPSRSSTDAGGVVATTILTVGEVWAAASALGPSVFTIRSPFFHEQNAKRGNVQSIRFAEAGVVVLGIALGGAASYLVQSPLPVLGAGVAIAVQLASWEWAMRSPADESERKAAAPLISATRGMPLW